MLRKVILESLVKRNIYLFTAFSPFSFLFGAWNLTTKSSIHVSRIMLLTMELFSRSSSMSVDYLKWKLIRLSNKGPLLSHLFFADDIILFSKITTKSFHAIIDVLNNFSQHSGQKNNFDKSKKIL